MSALPAGHPGVVLGAPLALQEVPGCAPIRLWLVDAATDLDRCYREAWDVDATPMWAFCWGSGLALARHVLDTPALVRGKVVVDFGAGSGVVAIAAALAGAARAIAVDTDLTALAFVRANAEANAVRVETSAELPEDHDLLLAADVLYERAARDFLLGRSPRAAMIVADALRPGTVPPAAPPFHEARSRAFPDVDPPMDRAYFYRFPAVTP